MIHLSQAAVSEIERLHLKHQPNSLLRLTVKLGGCSGLFYDMSFDEDVKIDDRVMEVNGIKVIIDTESFDYLNGLALDYSEDLIGGGFRFHNPQAIATCSCGNSFSTTAPTSSGTSN